MTQRIRGWLTPWSGGMSSFSSFFHADLHWLTSFSSQIPGLPKSTAASKKSKEAIGPDGRIHNPVARAAAQRVALEAKARAAGELLSHYLDAQRVAACAATEQFLQASATELANSEEPMEETSITSTENSEASSTVNSDIGHVQQATPPSQGSVTGELASPPVPHEPAPRQRAPVRSAIPLHPF